MPFPRKSNYFPKGKLSIPIYDKKERKARENDIRENPIFETIVKEVFKLGLVMASPDFSFLQPDHEETPCDEMSPHQCDQNFTYDLKKDVTTVLDPTTLQPMSIELEEKHSSGDRTGPSPMQPPNYPVSFDFGDDLFQLSGPISSAMDVFPPPDFYPTTLQPMSIELEEKHSSGDRTGPSPMQPPNYPVSFDFGDDLFQLSGPISSAMDVFPPPDFCSAEKDGDGNDNLLDQIRTLKYQYHEMIKEMEGKELKLNSKILMLMAESDFLVLSETEFHEKMHSIKDEFVVAYSHINRLFSQKLSGVIHNFRWKSMILDPIHLSILEDWFSKNLIFPFPDESDILHLCELTSLTKESVLDWFEERRAAFLLK
ncbi:hypothetical protein ADUPG1_013713 [Aduncisulcus paluster]|uniref:Homeobox domain-containing protein n=1 Tax=Aduncisulcus paluster TaxID=2918883 RepID=A0ABQ5K8N6_9EUKA|nr:hypothetical protein ADUPG1_013713 [Aduncisulcus paluster]